MATTFAQGTLMQRRTTTGSSPVPDTYTTIASVHSLTGPGMTGEPLDVSNQDTPSGFRAYISGMRTGGAMTFDISYAPADNTHDASATGLIGDLKDGSEERWRLIFNTPVTTATITAVTTATPVVVTSSSHPFTNGQSVLITGASGMTDLNNKTFVVSDKATNSFELSGFGSSQTFSGTCTATLQTFFQFQGFVSGFEVTAPVDGALMASVTLTSTGDVTQPVFA